VTRRAWILLAIGVVAAVLTGGAFARAGQSDFKPSKPQPGWGMFSPAAWRTVSSRIERRGFDAATIRLVGVTDTSDGRPFGLVAGRSRTGATCVTPVRGATVGATVCRLTKPLVVFSAPQTRTEGTPPRLVHATAVLGIARHDVAGIVVEDSRAHPTGMILVQTGRMLTFASGFSDPSSLRAFDAKGRTLARVVLRRP
jgi:hypothetical protein